MAPGDMKRMKLFAGSCVAIQQGNVGGSNATVMLLRALPSQKTLSGSMVLNRLWSSNFPDQSSSRKVSAKGDFGRYVSQSVSDIKLFFLNCV